jgi:hypothetical protein
MIAAKLMEVTMTGRENRTPHYPAVEMVLDGIADWVKTYRHAVDAKSEFAHCDPDEVKAIASDLGMTPSDLRTLASQGPEAAALLKRMLVALKVDPTILDKLDPRITRDLQRSCITCGEKRRCRHELAAGTAVGNMREFCPNALTLQDIFDAVNSRAARPH